MASRNWRLEVLNRLLLSTAATGEELSLVRLGYGKPRLQMYVGETREQIPREEILGLPSFNALPEAERVQVLGGLAIMAWGPRADSIVHPSGNYIMWFLRQGGEE